MHAPSPSPPTLPYHTPPTPAISTLSLHDALPIYARGRPSAHAWREKGQPEQIAIGGQRQLADFRRVDYRAESVVDRKSTRLNSSHVSISYAVFCLKKKKRRDGWGFSWRGDG